MIRLQDSFGKWRVRAWGGRLCRWRDSATQGRAAGRLAALGDESGASLVEFTVSAAVLFVMLFGIIECSLALYVYNYVSDAARQGSRYAMVRGTNCNRLADCAVSQAQVQTYLRGFQYPGLNVNNLTATVTWFSASATTPTTWTACGTPCRAAGNAVQVQVRYTYPLSIPWWKSATVNIGSISQMVISN